MNPTFEPDWLQPGMHVAMLQPHEVSKAAEACFNVKIRQGLGGLRLPETERIRSEVGGSPVAWVAGTKQQMARLPEKTLGSGFSGDYPDFCDLVHRRAAGRTSNSQISFYHNVGNQGLQFASIGGLVLKKAQELGLGQVVPTAWFVQDIRD